jgi:hypothetical protein
MSFSQRKGLKPVRSVVQNNSIDDALRSALWNALHLCIWNKYGDENAWKNYHTVMHTNSFKYSNLWNLFQRYWHSYFRIPLDTLPNYFEGAVERIRDYFFKCLWNEVYDFIEFTAQNSPNGMEKDFVDFCNRVLESEMSAYRLIDKQIVEITAEEEISSIEQALQDTGQFKGVQTHLQTALSRLSDRKQPDYRNSIKESISAVEALSRVLTGNDKATLGDALKILEKDHQLHGALKSGFSSIYGYTSDEGGIRHAMMDDPNLKFDDAKFMLVACTAFINYLIGKSK